jgi:hypothetical protein
VRRVAGACRSAKTARWPFRTRDALCESGT